MLYNLPKAIQSKVEKILNSSIQSIHFVGGGDINASQKIITKKGTFFIKFNNISTAFDMFEKEAKGLELLRASQSLKIPKSIAIGEEENTAFLLLEFIPSGYRTASFFSSFGASLAHLHRQTAPQFGLDHNNYIGRLLQSNRQQQNWADFYYTERLLPQYEMAAHQNLLSTQDHKALERLYLQLPSICPQEPPSLIHGDLWSGNFISQSNGEAVLIDPAVSYAHREMDIAMSRLFGGFDRTFYEAYQASFPMEKGWAARMDIYQLYYLLVHVNLFGGGYVNSVRKLLKRY